MYRPNTGSLGSWKKLGHMHIHNFLKRLPRAYAIFLFFLDLQFSLSSSFCSTLAPSLSLLFFIPVSRLAWWVILLWPFKITLRVVWTWNDKFYTHLAALIGSREEIFNANVNWRWGLFLQLTGFLWGLWVASCYWLWYILFLFALLHRVSCYSP